MFRSSLLIAAVACFVASASSENVPVLMWGPRSKAAPALENGLPEFTELIEQSPVTLAFVEETLSSEDLSLCKSKTNSPCFPNLTAVKSKSYFTQIHRPFDKLVELVEDVSYVSVDNNGKLDAQIPVRDGSVVVISFESNPVLSREENFAKHDAFIKKIYDDITSKIGNEKVLALYTAKSSISNVRRVRQAASSTATPSAAPSAAPPAALPAKQSSNEPTILTSDKLLVYFTELIFTDQGESKPITVTDMVISNQTANSFDVSLTTGGDPIKFTIANSLYGYWGVSNLEYGAAKNSTSTYTVGAADDFSYFCGPATNYTFSGGQILTWMNLQLQPSFTNSTKPMGRFNDPYNCIGFTSIPIWSGIFISFVLLFILSIGITWLMDIRTMDRFDDPKGKTIIVNTLE